MCGDAAAKAWAAGLARDLSWPAASIVDLGGVASARGPEHDVILFMGLFRALGTPAFNISVVR